MVSFPLMIVEFSVEFLFKISYFYESFFRDVAKISEKISSFHKFLDHKMCERDSVGKSIFRSTLTNDHSPQRILWLFRCRTKTLEHSTRRDSSSRVGQNPSPNARMSFQSYSDYWHRIWFLQSKHFKEIHIKLLTRKFQ